MSYEQAAQAYVKSLPKIKIKSQDSPNLVGGVAAEERMRLLKQQNEE